MLLIVALNAVEAAALKKAKEERRKLSELQKHPPKRQGDIYEGPNRDSVYRVSAHYIRKFFFSTQSATKYCSHWTFYFIL